MEVPAHLQRNRGTEHYQQQRSGAPGSNACAFTLIELLLIIAIIAILASLLLPALSNAQGRGKQVACVNHLKQFALALQMYAPDNDGKLPENSPQSPWVAGDMKNSNDATNLALLRAGKLFPYANQVDLYRCPADPVTIGGFPHVRSYSMNSWMGSRAMESLTRTNGYRTFVREAEIASAGASRLWIFTEEDNLTLDDGWFLVTMDDSRPFASRPAPRHSRSYALNFADAHVDCFKIRDPLGFEYGAQVSPKNLDWLKLKQFTTVR